MKKNSSLPVTTRAAVLQKQKTPLVVDVVQLPKQLSFGQVLVKIHTTTICGSQLNEIDGTKGEDKFLPHLLGHEGSGEVVAIGEGVRFVSPGDHVVLHWRPGNGLAGAPAQYGWQGKPLNAGPVTTFQEYTVVSENRVTKIPSDFDLSLAPLFGCAVTTAMGVVTNEAQVKVGQSVVVFGVGGVGLNVIQAAALAGAYPIVAVDIVDAKLEIAKTFGATHSLNSVDHATGPVTQVSQKNLQNRLRLKASEDSFGTPPSRHPLPPTVETQNFASLRERIHDIVGDTGADVVIDTTGIVSVVEQAYALTQPMGKTILVGVVDQSKTIAIKTLPLHFGKILIGSHGGLSQPAQDIPRLIRLAQANKLRLEGIITHQFPLDDVNEAIALMRTGQAGRVALFLDSHDKKK